MKAPRSVTNFSLARIARRISAQLTPQEHVALTIIAFLFMLGTVARLWLTLR